jgi:hypothetical protein
LKDGDHGCEYPLERRVREFPRAPRDDRVVRREQLARSGDARDQQATGDEVGRVERHRERIAVGIAGDLAEDLVAAPGVGQAHRRAEFRGGQVRERKPDEYYFPD